MRVEAVIQELSLRDNRVESATPNEAVLTSPWYSLASIATMLPTGMPNVIVII